MELTYKVFTDPNFHVALTKIKSATTLGQTTVYKAMKLGNKVASERTIFVAMHTKLLDKYATKDLKGNIKKDAQGSAEISEENRPALDADFAALTEIKFDVAFAPGKAFVPFGYDELFPAKLSANEFEALGHMVIYDENKLLGAKVVPIASGAVG